LRCHQLRRKPEMAVVELPSNSAGPKKRPPRIGDQEATNGIAAVDCCKITIIGNTQRFTCKHPGCGREYASRDAVRKHCRIRHLAWLRGLSRTSSREVEVLPSPTAGSPLGSLLSPLLTPTLAPLTPGMSPTVAAMGCLEINNIPALELNGSSSPEEEQLPASEDEMSGLDALVTGSYLLSALNTLSALAVAANDQKAARPFDENVLRAVPVAAA